jgi:hypothetical protein
MTGKETTFTAETSFIFTVSISVPHFTLYELCTIKKCMAFHFFIVVVGVVVSIPCLHFTRLGSQINITEIYK